MKESIEVNILGKTYAFRSEFDQHFMKETAKVVNARMQEITKRTGTVSTEKVAILTAMNLAGEYLKLKDENTSVKGRVKNSGNKILKIVDSLL